MKFLNLLFVLALVFSFASCGGAEKAEETTTEDSTKVEEVTPAPAAEEAPADSTKTEEKKEEKKDEKKAH